MNSFWAGFEKRAYGYKHDIREQEQHYKSRAKDEPMSKMKASLVGAGIGGVLGGGLGAFGNTGGLKGALIGGAVGAAGGGLMGLLTAIGDKLGIEEAKRIMAMSPKERKDYLKYLARQGEITERERQEWDRWEWRERHRDHREDMRNRRY